MALVLERTYIYIVLFMLNMKCVMFRQCFSNMSGMGFGSKNLVALFVCWFDSTMVLMSPNEA